MRTFIIGDIHGSLKALDQCLERSGFNKEKDMLITLGDVADGWGDTAGVVERLLEIPNAIHLTGNHDYWAYEWLKFGLFPGIWLSQGGQATVDSYGENFPLKQKHLEKFFEKQEPYYVDEDKNRLFVHGGIREDKAGEGQHYSVYWWDRKMWNRAMMVPDGKVNSYDEVFIGHTSTLQWKCKPHFPEAKDPNQEVGKLITVPMHRANVWNLDTGGGWYGKLTIMNVDTKEYWQSDPVQELHSDEAGRR